MKLSRRAEDYLRIIYEIRKEKGRVRIKDIACALGVRPPTVTEMVDKLGRKGLVTYEKRGRISLTEEGEKLARNVKDRHVAIVRLLEIAGVPGEVARKDAHKIEHIVSIETIECIKNFVRKMGG